MNRLSFLHWLFITALVTIGLTGCTIERRNGADGDIEEFSPPVVPIAQQTATMTTTPTLEPTTAITTTTPTIEPTTVITPTPTLAPPAVTTSTLTLESPGAITSAQTLVSTAILARSPIPAPPGATIGFCYRVQRGETIYSLAQQFDTSPYAINLANDLFPPNLVYTYQALFIPTQLGRGPNVYIYEEGDTLGRIAETCGLPASMIAGVNGLDSDITLQVGDAIIIPIPPFPPPARFNYPVGPLPLAPYPPRCCNAYPPYQPGPPLYE